MNTLQDFINFLHYNDFIYKDKLYKDNEVGYRTRFKLQHLVFLAQERYGLNLGYDFSIYKQGPYSPELADYYYNERNNRKDNSFELPEEFKDHDFIRLKHTSERWLETAATLLSLSHHFPQRDKLIDRVMNMKSSIKKDHINRVYDEIF